MYRNPGGPVAQHLGHSSMLVYWLATFAQKPKRPGSSPPVSYCKGELSAVIARLISKHLLSGWK